MPVRGLSCNFKNEGTAVHMLLPRGSLTELSEALQDCRRHKGEILLVLNRKRQMLEVVTGKRFNIIKKEFKP